MSHIPYTICRSGTYYYNRRVPIHAVDSYGLFIRHALSKDPLKAEAFSKRLSDVLEGDGYGWGGPYGIVLRSSKSGSQKFSPNGASSDYLLSRIWPTPWHT